MKLSLIPYPSKITYLNGFSKTDAQIIKITDTSVSKESFRLHIENSITIEAADAAGFYYAELLLEQIKFQCGQNLPNVHIEDSPRYEFRSFMVDCCRHFFDVDTLKEMIEYCAKLRFNVFHWHITEDQGWRPEIKAYPELIETGSVRFGSNFGKEQTDEPYSGHFTQDEMREIVEFAYEHHMQVVPELDMPGPTSALLASLPHLVCGGKQVDIKTTGGIFKDIICAGKESSYETLFKILDEICDIFPDEYIHIGGDEAPKVQWKNCPDCQRKIKEENLKNEEELQGYFINRIASYLESKGKKVITWNESLNSGILSKDIVVQMWMDPKKLSKKSPNKLIASDFYHRYVDYPYHMTPLKKVYNYNTDINKNVIGTDIPIWTEYVSSFEYMQYMCFPRYIAAAQAGWSKTRPNYKVFKSHLKELLPWFGIEHCAKEEEWDPPTPSRIKQTINHFGRNCPNATIRNFFLNKEEQEEKK